MIGHALPDKTLIPVVMLALVLVVAFQPALAETGDVISAPINVDEIHAEPDAVPASHGGTLVMDPIPSSVSVGSTVTFSGRLTAADGNAVSGAIIHIKDDVTFGSDTTIRTATTDSNGYFDTTWTARVRSSGAWDFYAVYEGSTDVGHSRSTTYSVNVVRYQSTITLNPLPGTAIVGDTITFSGTLAIESQDPGSRTILIKDDVDLGTDTVIGTVQTDTRGGFEMAWTAQARSSGSWDFYAVYEGDSNSGHARSQTHSVYVPRQVSSEGARTIAADMLNAEGYTGKGIKVAVIDTGFDITNPEISRNIAEYRSFRSDNDIRGDNYKHGTASAEVIVDIAPDAQLYLYNPGGLGFFDLVDYLIQRGDIDIVSMSLIYADHEGPVDGTGRFAQKVNEARDNGILWFNSAGNYATSHWEGKFNDPDGDGWHNFEGGDETVGFDIFANDWPLSLSLSWWGSPSQDFDLYLYHNDAIIARSTNFQPALPPFESIHYTSDDRIIVQAAIKRNSGAGDAYFQFFSYSYDMDDYSMKSRSIAIPADASGAISVGANHWASDVLEPYSSQGPTLDGRIKPDISAPTCGSSSVYSDGYCGTSGSNPHAAGAAALVMQKYPDATADQVQKLLEYTVKSRHAKSNQDGTGRVDLRMLVDSDVLALDPSNRGCMSYNTCFLPETLKISRGDTVRWINADTASITITGGSGGETFEGRMDGRGDVYSKQFSSDGTFTYSSSSHPWATGRIIVGSGTSPPPDPTGVTIEPAMSAGVPGCEHTASGCFIPNTATIDVGSRVTFSNTDTVAHTFTSGTPQSGHDGTFDSGLVITGSSYEYVANRQGEFPYMCIIHPWMTGSFTVSGSDGDDGELRDAVRDLRAATTALTARITALESTIDGLATRIAVLEANGGTPPPEPMTGARGKVYMDANNNGVLDPGERGRPGVTVLTVSLADHSDVNRVTTDAAGGYAIELDAGGYLIQAIGSGSNGFAYVTIPDGTMLVRNLAY